MKRNSWRIISIIILLGPILFGSSKPDKGLPRPKNVIILIGDGVGYNHYLVTNQYFGTTEVVQERFPVKLALAHYPAKAGEYGSGKKASNYMATGYNPALAWKDTAYLKRDYTESAASATALATGVKTYNNAIGLSVNYDTLENLVERAKSLGKSAGVVTSVPFNHATPAGFVAHNITRKNYSQLASEMIFDSRCDVIMGCGDPGYDNDGNPLKGKWDDSRNVIDSSFWQDFISGSGKETTFMVKGKSKTVHDIDGDSRPDSWTVVRDRNDFRSMASGKTPGRVLGCPRTGSTLQQGRTMQNGETKNSPPFVTPFVESVPTLAEMTAAALNVLDNNPEGFFVMIEGGAPDWTGHANQKGRLIEEMKDFNDAVRTVTEWVEKHSSWDETLVIVTGDHETGLLWGEKPFVTPVSNGKGKLPVMNFFSEDHTNSLIPFFARGSGSEFYRGFADEYDSIRGPFLHNSEVPQLVKLLWPK